MTGRRGCTVTGCGKKTVARRLCRAHYQAAWAAGELAAHATEPKRPRLRDRKVCPPDHKHDAASTCYIQHQCRCDPCTDANTARERRRSKLKAYGRFDTGLVDAEPVRAHLLMLGEAGLGYKRVAKLAGIGTTPVRNIIWGRQEPGPRYGEIPKRVKRETAEAILRVQPALEYLAAGQLVPAAPYVRRIRALVALGWSQARIAAELGVSRANFRLLRQYETADSHKERVKITAGLARAIVALYDRWSMTPPPERTGTERAAAQRAREYARARRWPLPMDWEASSDGFESSRARRSAA